MTKTGYFKLFIHEKIGPNTNIVPSSFVVSIRRKERSEALKACFFGGHRGRDKCSVLHKAYTLKKSPLRLVLASASILSFDMWATNINQAYL